MSLFTKLREAVQSWARRRVGTKSRKRSDLMMEQLDHRQLLAVNFTGVVANDFPNTGAPGVQVLYQAPISTPGGTNHIPVIPGSLQNIVSSSGFEIDELRVSYTAADDTLNVGVEGPFNGRDGREVIAGDSDNNGNSATVDPRISDGMGGGIAPLFQDPGDMGGTKTYGVFLELNGSTTPQVVAGFPIGLPTDTAAKPYEVALASTTAGVPVPTFDQANLLPQYTGNYYLANDPNHPNFELQINHFSQLYQQITGQTFSQTSPVSIGGFGQSIQDAGISDEFFPGLAVNFPQATVPLPPPPVPPIVPPPPPPPVVQECSPTVYVNYHESNHINTAHNSAIRVTVLGSSGFDPTTLIPSTVKFGDPTTINTNGASPILEFERNVNHDGFPDETFVFNGLDVTLPPGITDAEIIGTTTSGQNIESTVQVFNRDYSFYTQKQIDAQQAAWVKYDKLHGIDTTNGIVPPPVAIPKAAQQRAASAAIDDLYNPFAGKKVPQPVVTTAAAPGAASAASLSPAPAVTVSIPKKHGKTPKVSASQATPAVIPLTSMTGAG